MGEHTSKPRVAGEQGRSTLGALIHAAVREAIEMAVEAELTATLGAGRYERRESRHGYRNGRKTRTLSGPTGALALTLPRATVATGTGRTEWRSTLVPRYQRRLAEVNTAVLATYLAGGNTRRIRGALAPLLHGAPLSRSAVSRIVATLTSSLHAWQTRPLGDLEVVYAYLDALALRVRTGGKVVRVPVLAVVGVLNVALEPTAGPRPHVVLPSIPLRSRKNAISDFPHQAGVRWARGNVSGCVNEEKAV